jgi:outer membrane autotransporter protein
MRRLLSVSVTLLTMSAGSALAGNNCPAPAPAPTPTPSQAPAVTPDTASQSASATTGMISDRVATVVSSVNTASAGGTGERQNMQCGENNLDELDRALGATTSSAVDGGGKRLNSVWSSGSYNHVKKADVNGRYGGDVKNGVVGYDRRVTRDLILGIAAGYEAVNISTQYNHGEVEGDSVSLSPYVGYVINDWLSADATLGYSWIHYDFVRDYNTVHGSTNAGRVFGSANLNATQRLGNLGLKGGLGFLRLYEQQAGYTDSTGANVDKAEVNFGQLRATIGGGYDFVTGFGTLTPNAFVRAEYDLPAAHSVMVGNGWQSSSDRTGAVFGLGLDAAIGQDLLLNLTATSTQFRQNTEAYSLVGNVRYSF